MLTAAILIISQGLFDTTFEKRLPKDPSTIKQMFPEACIGHKIPHCYVHAEYQVCLCQTSK